MYRSLVGLVSPPTVHRIGKVHCSKGNGRTATPSSQGYRIHHLRQPLAYPGLRRGSHPPRLPTPICRTDDLRPRIVSQVGLHSTLEDNRNPDIESPGPPTSSSGPSSRNALESGNMDREPTRQHSTGAKAALRVFVLQGRFHRFSQSGPRTDCRRCWGRFLAERQLLMSGSAPAKMFIPFIPLTTDSG